MIRKKKLKCGVTLVMEQVPFVQSASLGIWAKAGSRDETENISGISHLIEHMLFKGTDNRSARDIAEDVDKIGAQINAFTGKEATCYYIKTLSSNLEKAAEILLDMMLNPLFDETELEKEKHVIYEEMKMIQDAPDEDAHDIMLEKVFRGSPLEKPIIGTQETVGSITSSDIRQYMKSRYARNSIVVAIAGNFDEDLISDYFNDAFESFVNEKMILNETEKPYETSYFVKVRDIEQSHICLARRAVSLEDKRSYAYSLLTNVFGGSMSSRLFQNIREDKGLAYSVYSINTGYEDSGYFNIYAGVAHDKIADCLDAIKTELLDIKKNGITELELEMAKQQVKSTYVFGQENVNNRMFQIGKNMTICGVKHELEEIIAGYDCVTMEDINEIIDMIADIDDYCGIAVTGVEFDLEKHMKN